MKNFKTFINEETRKLEHIGDDDIIAGLDELEDMMKDPRIKSSSFFKDRLKQYTREAKKRKIKHNSVK